ncbi:MAG: hypothetical protein LBT79_07505, partial [Elusimicrobiota bacterium]|nr:hypothetical protein [Elusimicrobiota bacterium]
TIKGWNGSASVARTLSGNNAYDGFIFDNKDTVNFQNISFTMFKNTTGSGSVIWSNSTKINISGNVTFSNNTSYLNGGAIYAKNASQITIIASDNLVFSGNMANGENNDIYLDNSDLILNVSNGKSLVLNGGIKGSG